MWEFEDKICYGCGTEFQDDNDVTECPHCGSYDVDNLEDAMEEAGLLD